MANIWCLLMLVPPFRWYKYDRQLSNSNTNNNKIQQTTTTKGKAAAIFVYQTKLTTAFSSAAYRYINIDDRKLCLFLLAFLCKHFANKPLILFSTEFEQMFQQAVRVCVAGLFGELAKVSRISAINSLKKPKNKRPALHTWDLDKPTLVYVPCRSPKPNKPPTASRVHLRADYLLVFPLAISITSVYIPDTISRKKIYSISNHSIKIIGYLHILQYIE